MQIKWQNKKNIYYKYKGLKYQIYFKNFYNEVKMQKYIIKKWAKDISRQLTRTHIKMALKHMKRFSTSQNRINAN